MVKKQTLFWVALGVGIAALFAYRVAYTLDLNRPMLKFLQKNYHNPMTGVEVGVYKGRNSKRMFNMLPIKHMYLIDPYLNYEGYIAKLNLEQLLINTIETAQEPALNRLEPYQDRYTFLFKKSEDAALDIPGNLDFVYIDGNHSYPYVLKDIELFYPKVKNGGVIGGHDIFCNDVRKAVEDFATRHNFGYYYYDNPDWWIVK